MNNLPFSSDPATEADRNEQAQAAFPQPPHTSSSSQRRPARNLPGYIEITLTHGSPLRPNLTECPICILDITPIQETLTHSNGTCNRSFHQDCFERWVADMGTCANCRERLRSEHWDIVLHALNPDFHAENGFQNEIHRARVDRQSLAGQELLEYHVTWVLSRVHHRLNRQNTISQFPSPFGETDILRLWFFRHRAHFRSAGGLASRWEDLVEYSGPHSPQTQLTIAQYQDIRLAFRELIRLLPRVRGRNLTEAVFDPNEPETSTWELSIAPLFQDETRNEVTETFRRWTLAFDQVVYLEERLDAEQEARPIWERLVDRLDSRLDREWRR